MPPGNILCCDYINRVYVVKKHAYIYHNIFGQLIQQIRHECGYSFQNPRLVVFSSTFYIKLIIFQYKYIQDHINRD